MTPIFWPPGAIAALAESDAVKPTIDLAVFYNSVVLH